MPLASRAGGSRQRRHQKVTERPFEKFETPPRSRYHSWKCQVEPATIVPPGGAGSVAGTSKPVPTLEFPNRFSNTPLVLNLPTELRVAPAEGV